MDQEMKAYEYPIKRENGTTYFGHYSIKANAKPLGFEGEKLISTYTIKVK